VQGGIQSSLRRDSIGKTSSTFSAPKHVTISVAVSVFPDEIYATLRSWVEQAFPKLIHYNRLDKGGHFAAREHPQLFVQEIRASFRPLRQK
jgi:pimeloyl-ACP methyl ester carboxylesterase